MVGHSMTTREDCLDKVAAAKYHLRLMQEHLADRDVFRYDLAAFLSAVRSPLQYVHVTANPNEARPRPNPRAAVNRPMLDWYQAQVRRAAILGFFRDERNLDIHQTPVTPQGHVRVSGIVGNPFPRPVGLLGNSWRIDADGNRTLLHVSEESWEYPTAEEAEGFSHTDY